MLESPLKRAATAIGLTVAAPFTGLWNWAARSFRAWCRACDDGNRDGALALGFVIGPLIFAGAVCIINMTIRRWLVGQRSIRDTCCSGQSQ